MLSTHPLLKNGFETQRIVKCFNTIPRARGTGHTEIQVKGCKCVAKALEGVWYRKRMRDLVVLNSGEEKAWGDLRSMYKYLMNAVKRMEPGSFQWCQVTGQERMGTNWNTGISTETKETFFFLGMVVYAVLWSLVLVVIKTLAGCGPGQPALVYFALSSGCWKRQLPDITSNISCYVFLWNDQNRRHFLQFCLSNCWFYFVTDGSAVGCKWLIIS